MKGRNLRIYSAIFLISMATLTYEIGLTRLFSLAQGYHFAFMVISISLMGIGAGGTLLYLTRNSLRCAIYSFDTSQVTNRCFN